MFSVRCRAYSGLELGETEHKCDDHELGDDDDVVDDNSKSTFVRLRLVSSAFGHCSLLALPESIRIILIIIIRVFF